MQIYMTDTFYSLETSNQYLRSQMKALTPLSVMWITKMMKNINI